MPLIQKSSGPRGGKPLYIPRYVHFLVPCNSVSLILLSVRARARARAPTPAPSSFGQAFLYLLFRLTSYVILSIYLSIYISIPQPTDSFVSANLTRPESQGRYVVPFSINPSPAFPNPGSRPFQVDVTHWLL
ncbi:hypothetical protein LZ31DRAFT_119490 [Colletotrichum somersetense]|nr:hypothetical protein LZ31DRAFT_119490 [Colletotrichum somersetense]